MSREQLNEFCAALAVDDVSKLRDMLISTKVREALHKEITALLAIPSSIDMATLPQVMDVLRDRTHAFLLVTECINNKSQSEVMVEVQGSYISVLGLHAYVGPRLEIACGVDALTDSEVFDGEDEFDVELEDDN